MSATVAASEDSSEVSTSVDQATTRLRDAIAEGTLTPGSRVKISEAADRFGFSAMPIREALRKLEGEGLIQITPNRGATVRAVDRKFVEDIYEVRTALEVMTVAKCARIMTLDKLVLLESLLEEHRAAQAANDFGETVRTSRMFHLKMFELSGNLEAQRIFQYGWEIINTLRLQLGYSEQRKRNMIVEYTGLLDALRQQDEERAQVIVRMHHRAGMEDLLDHLEKDWKRRGR